MQRVLKKNRTVCPPAKVFNDFRDSQPGFFLVLFVLYSFGLLLLAALPAGLVFRNLKLFRFAEKDDSPNPPAGSSSPGVSVLIPARNEEVGIADAVRSVVSNLWPELEVIVMDDNSTDRTAEIVSELAGQDPRIQLARAAGLPEGWNGKQHACWQLSQIAKFDLLLFMDADVRLQADAIARLVTALHESKVSLLSGFPNQEMGTLSEQLLIPMMYFVLLGYLPLDQMRASAKPEFGAGCGQLFLAEKTAYMHSGGHQAIQASRHDGLKLPRAFRAAGFMSDLFDASDIATVRMYHGWNEVMRGLMKNAAEGIANPKLIVLFSILLLGAAVWPILSFAHAVVYGWPIAAILLLGAATVLSFVPRLLIARRLGHSLLGVVLHPVSVSVFVIIQWVAFFRALVGAKEIAWRGRQ